MTILLILYLFVGFFLSGLYAGSIGNVTTWDKAVIILFWLPGIAYIVGYKLGREHKLKHPTSSRGAA